MRKRIFLFLSFVLVVLLLTLAPPASATRVFEIAMFTMAFIGIAAKSLTAPV
jgi:hypothetical protein